jgi:uncharacterized paraquat-inducible protein A
MTASITCYDCDEEFTVDSLLEKGSQVSFCPFCGTEIEQEEDDDLDDEDIRD